MLRAGDLAQPLAQIRANFWELAVLFERIKLGQFAGYVRRANFGPCDRNTMAAVVPVSEIAAGVLRSIQRRVGTLEHRFDCVARRCVGNATTYRDMERPILMHISALLDCPWYALGKPPSLIGIGRW